MDEVKNITAQLFRADDRRPSSSASRVTLCTLPGPGNGDLIPLTCPLGWALVGLGPAADVPFEVDLRAGGLDGGTFEADTGAWVIPRIALSNCGFNICPNGVSRTVFGNEVM